MYSTRLWILIVYDFVSHFYIMSHTVSRGILGCPEFSRMYPDGSELEDTVTTYSKDRKSDDSPRKRMNKSRTKRARENGDSSAAYEPSDVQEETLYTAVLSGKAPMTELAAGWIERYQDDRDTALLEIIQFFISSSGCKSTVTPQLYRGIGSGFQEVLKTMTDEFGEEGSEYPLTLTGTNFRRFKPSLGDFITQLVKQCAQAELLYDEFMMDYVLQLLSEMSASHVRPFRHTGTFCAMKLMSALVGVALNVNKEIEDTTKQYEGECNKHGTERSTDALDMLNDRKAELETHQQEVEQFLNTIFKDIFIMRYRDICSDIRVICMDEISVWMRTFPKGKVITPWVISPFGSFPHLGHFPIWVISSIRPFPQLGHFSVWVIY